MAHTRITLDDLLRRPDLAARLRSPAMELLDGELVRQPLPSAGVVRTVVQVAASFDERAFSLRVGVRDPVAAPPADVLRPEVSLARPGETAFARPAPPAHRLVLAVLVCDRSDLAHLRLRRCAVAGVPEVWVLAAEPSTGASYSDPVEGRYRRRELLLPGEPCSPREVPWLQVVPLPRRDDRAQMQRQVAA